MLVSLAAPSAWAAATSSYGQWSTSQVTVPVTGFPGAQVSTNATNPSVGSGASAFLNAATPFGAAYGSSRNKSYLLVNSASGRTPSTTTLRFAAPTPVGWGIALGDVDADQVRVSATGADGQPLTTAQLGFQSTFNFCNGVTPRPGTCTATATDTPTWDPATGTLIGNGVDTNGASGWLRPTVPVTSVTLTFSVLTGIPVFQVWIASPSTQVLGSVTDSCATAPGTTLELRQDGRPVLDSSGDPVTTTAGPDGHYGFAPLAPGRYQVRPQVPDGYRADPADRTADTSGDPDADGVDFTVHCPVPVVEPPITVPPTATSVDIPVTPQIPPEQPVVITDPPKHGTVVEKSPGVLTYTPKPTFTGTDSFVYQGKTAAGKVVAVKVTVKVPPRASREHARTPLAATGASNTRALAAAAAVLIVLGGLASMAARRRRR